MSTMKLLSSAVAVAFVAAFAACNDPVGSGSDNSTTQYGPAQSVGNGTVRTYVTVSADNPNVPVEIGVVMSESALEGLPSASMAPQMNHGAMAAAAPMPMSAYLLDLPQQNPTPYKFVQFDWNPLGHEPAGVYDLPHFDFHFYTVSKDVRASIVPTDPNYAAKAAAFPADSLRAQFYIDAATPAGITPGQAAVPEMGLHWLDVRSPELQQIAGHPEAYQPFTKTFIYGSWNGAFIFDEPMITRAYILAKKTATDPAVRDELIPVPVAAHYSPAGYYPGAYRITWDPEAKEYRIALTQLTQRN